MGLFSGCLLACDVDDTLMSNGRIHPRNREKIEYFMAEGGRFSLATGRTVGAVSPVLRQLKRVSPSVMANGAMLYDFERETVLYEEYIPQSDGRVVGAVLALGENIGIEIHAGTHVLTAYENEETRAHQQYEALESRTVSYEEACRSRWNKVVYMFESPEQLQRVEKAIHGIQGQSDFMETSANISGRKRWYLEQVPRGISKAGGLDRLCRMLSVKEGCRFAIGDYYNDLEMIKNADISAAPSTALEEVKAQADFIGGSCADGAVADFIEYLSAFLLSKKGRG